MTEKELWPVVEKTLKTKYGCSTSWCASSGRPLGRLRAGMGSGQPDVIGVSTGNDNAGIHIVEGKLLHAARNKFNETISQLNDWRGHGDYLWAAFAQSDWEQVKSHQQQAWENDLRKGGIGLVLVDGVKSEVFREADKNPHIDTECQNIIRKCLGLKLKEEPIPYFSMGRDTALSATGALAWCYEIFMTEAK